jgi:hypothetical protein
MFNPPPDISSHLPGTKRGEEWTLKGDRDPDGKATGGPRAMQPASTPRDVSQSIHACPIFHRPN